MEDMKLHVGDTYSPSGRPDHYPVPQVDRLLFYIQRNHNSNTVVYRLNQNACGQINYDTPMDVFWIKFHVDGQEESLNYIQNKLAYGYESSVINPTCVEFNFVSYKKQFFIRIQEDKSDVITRINGEMSVLSNIYVHAEEIGVFPDVKFVEFYGNNLETNENTYERIKF